MRTLTAVCTRSGDWWAVEVPEMNGLFTQARRLDQVAAMVTEAASLLTGSPETDFEVSIVANLPESDQGLVDRAKDARTRLLQAEREAAQANRTAVADLRDCGLTVRDVATLLGVTPARVSQLAA